jgi:fructokinase
MIICCGEALMDMLPRPLEDGGEAYLPVPGGAMYNTAVALGRLGEETGFLSGLSTDLFGQQLIDHLKDSGVNVSYCVRSPKPTTLAFVSLKDGNAEYSFYDENTAARMLTVDEFPVLPETVHAYHFGAISLIQEPCGSAFEALMRRVHQTAVISLDPNIRPGFVTDESAYRERLKRVIAMSDIIKVSEEDLAWLEPGKRFEQIAHHWIDGGASIVTLTMGSKGARSITPSSDVTLPTMPVEVVDTVGAGDTYNAGFLASLRSSDVLSRQNLRQIDQDSLRLAMQCGAKVAAYTVGQAGANPPWRRDLDDTTCL